MQYFIEKIKHNERNQHFILYCFTFLIYGAYINCLGPLIPYLAKQYHFKETEYSSFFTMRTISYVIGAIFIRYTINKFKYHSVLVVANTIIFFSCWLFLSPSFQTQLISIALVNGMFSLIDPILNVLLLIFNSDQDKQFWILIGHSVFGIGSLLAPILVFQTELNTFTILGVINVFSVFGYWYLQSPKQKQSQVKNMRLSSQSSLNQKLNSLQSQSFSISDNALYILAFLFFIYIGEQVTFGGWIASYAVLTGFATQKEATMLSTLYYIIVTIFRIVFIFRNPQKPSQDLKTLLLIKVFTSILLVFIQYKSPALTCYTGCFLYGISMAPLYAKFLSLSNEFKIYLSGQNFATIIIIGSVGEAAFASITGYLMNFTPYFFYWCMLFMGVASYFLLLLQINIFKNETKKQSKIIQLKN